MRDWKKAAEILASACSPSGALQAPRSPLIHETWSAAFVEMILEVARCRVCGDAILPCEACSTGCCSNGLCAESKHAGCPAMEG